MLHFRFLDVLFQVNIYTSQCVSTFVLRVYFQEILNLKVMAKKEAFNLPNRTLYQLSFIFDFKTAKQRNKLGGK